MQFVHPTVLYALLLLLIPVIVHLFQLRRFQRVDFTNVAFLRKVTLQTRKSSQLKKWLVLLTRMLALAALVIAFAQPYTSSREAATGQSESVIYLDNSFSMQAKGASGSLLDRTVQQLYETPLNTDILHWFTNDKEYPRESVDGFKRAMVSQDYTHQSLDPELVYLKAQRMFSEEAGKDRRLIWISDFQSVPTPPAADFPASVDLVQLRPENRSNLAIDSLYIEKGEGNLLKLNVQVSARNYEGESVAISVFDGNRLLTKSGVPLEQGPGPDGLRSGTMAFDLDYSQAIRGRVILTDPNLPYDNVLHFAIQPSAQIKVLAINQADDDFIYRLFRGEEFQYSRQEADNLNYATLANQDLIILNELKDIPPALIDAITSFSTNGGSLLIVPSNEVDLTAYNQLIRAQGLGELDGWVDSERAIAKIAFDHPLFAEVFEREVVNFQYPTTTGYYSTKSTAAAVLSYENDSPYLLESENSYLLTAPLNESTSNMQASPLIVPCFYNLAKQSLPLPDLYYTIGERHDIGVDLSLGQEEIVQLRDSLERFIPLQQARANSLLLTTEGKPDRPGTYEVILGDSIVGLLSYNYPRDQGLMQYPEIPASDRWSVHQELVSAFNELNEDRSDRSYWKWFVTFAVLMLLVEMSILKFVR